MKLRVCATALLVALLMTVLAPLHATRAAPSTGGTLTVTPVTGSGPAGDTFAGTLTLTKFVSTGGQLAVVGTLSGTVTSALGATLGTVSGVRYIAPVYQGDPTCQILYLHTGEITLTLLGLTVDIAPITINITANSAQGLLGALLCDVANLLNGGGPAASIAALLNQILAILGGL